MPLDRETTSPHWGVPGHARATCNLRVLGAITPAFASKGTSFLPAIIEALDLGHTDGTSLFQAVTPKRPISSLSLAGARQLYTED